MEILSSVSETALITLRSRVIESCKEHALINDPMGKEILEKIYKVLPEKTRKGILKHNLPSALTVHIALRARKYDAYAKDFIRKHPEGIIVNLGCGFDSRYWRIAVNPDQYWEVDLPEVIMAKQQILGTTAPFRMIGCSVLDTEWITQLAAGQSKEILFLAEGLFMYLDQADVIALLKKVAATFTASEIVLEVVNASYTKGFMKKMVAAKMKYSLGSEAGTSYNFGVKNAQELESYANNLKVLEEWSYLEDDDIKPGIMKLFRNSRMFTRTQWTIKAAIR